MRRLASAVLFVALLAPAFGFLVLVTEPEAAAPSAPVGPKVVRGPQLTHPDPTVWPTPPFVSQPDPELLRPRTRGTTGTVKVVVILAEFPGTTHLSQKSRAFFETQINGNTGTTMRTYYREVSYNLLTVEATIVDWVNVGRPMSEYGMDGAGTDDGNGPVYRLVVDAVNAADLAGFNFASFDEDGPFGTPDGVVDHLFVIHAGDAQESSADPSDSARRIWSHRWAVADGNELLPGDQQLIVDGKEVYGYIMASETSPLGVFVHEFGHDLGLPDLYDIDGSSKGVGLWDVMGSGSWNGNPRGTSPAHFTSWGKARLGWLSPDEVTTPRFDFSLPPLGESASALKLPIQRGEGGEEYFLVEYRRWVGYDAALPSEGLLILHIDDAQDDNADESHRLVDVEEADERLSEDRDNAEDPGDLWVDDANGFTPESVPNSNGYGNLPTGWKVRRIGPAQVASIEFDVSRDIDDDLAVVALYKPSGIEQGSVTTITATITNNGGRPQSNIPVTLTVFRNVFNDTEGSESRLGDGETKRIPTLTRGQFANVSWEFTQTVPANYIIEAAVALAEDEIPENNDRISHVGVYNFLLSNDVEGEQTGWTANAPSTNAYKWAHVGPGRTTEDAAAFSGTHAWRFGQFQAGTTPGAGPWDLTSPAVMVTADTAYLTFQHRRLLTGLILENSTTPPETDEAWFELRFNGGTWFQPDESRWFRNEPAWSKAYYNLTALAVEQGVPLPYSVQFRWRAEGRNQANDGGWWIDDIFVVRQNLTYGLAVKPAVDYALIDPGGETTLYFKVYNVGDFPDTYRFRTPDLPEYWATAVRTSTNQSVLLENYTLSLGTDRESTLRLLVFAPPNVPRGTTIVLKFEAVSENDERQTNAFELLVEVYDPVGFGKFLRYLPLFFILLIVLGVIAAVVRKVKGR